jgi:hypothetical protein
MTGKEANMPKKKKKKTRQPRVKKDKQLQAIYDRIRREFTAADLKLFTEEDEGIPADDVLDEMEAIHRKLTRKRA